MIIDEIGGIENAKEETEIVDEVVHEINVMNTSLHEMTEDHHQKNPDEIQGAPIDEIDIDVSFVHLKMLPKI